MQPPGVDGHPSITDGHAARDGQAAATLTTGHVVRGTLTQTLMTLCWHVTWGTDWHTTTTEAGHVVAGTLGQTLMTLG